jgi:hypothetical protein
MDTDEMSQKFKGSAFDMNAKKENKTDDKNKSK